MLQEIKQQVQALEKVLAVETSAENDDAVAATRSQQRSHASSRSPLEGVSEEVTEADVPLPARTKAVEGGRATEGPLNLSKDEPVPVPVTARNDGGRNEGSGEPRSDWEKGSKDGLKTSSSGAVATKEEHGATGDEGSGGGAGVPPGVGRWLEGLVPLPGGYKTTRRDVLRLVPLGGALASFGFLLSHAKVRTSALCIESGCRQYVVVPTTATRETTFQNISR